jgi:protein involved in polysaccharide export with SLBB domain
MRRQVQVKIPVHTVTPKERICMSGPETTDQQCFQEEISASSACTTSRVVNNRKVLQLLAGVIASAAAISMGGCAETAAHDVGKNLGDYLNLRNSFLDPSQVGRFDKTNPWGRVKPVRWPILDQLDVDDEPLNHWASAGDPMPADLVPEVKEYTLAPSDTISVSVYELLSPGQDFVQQRRVNELGYVNLQSIGPVLVSGLTPSQLESKIAQTLIEKRILPGPDANTPGPQVNVQVLDSRQHVFSFLGSVSRPGTYNVLAADFRLLDAIALAGDIPTQPGMDYLYVIRQIPYTQKTDAGGTTGAPAATSPVAKPATPGGNPLGTLEQIEKGTQTEPTTVPPAVTPPSAPTTGPKSEGDAPKLLRPLPTAAVVGNGASLGTVAAADGLDAALGVPGATTAKTTTSGPAGEPIPEPAPPATGAATEPATTPATAAAVVPATQAQGGGIKVPVTKPADLKLLESAVGPTPASQGTRFVFIDGRWVPIPAHAPTTNPAVAVNQGVPVPTTNEISVAPPPDKLVQQRIIRIPLAALREGVSKYNIIVRPGDIVNVPPVEPGEFYLMGNIARPGVYALTGRKVTLKMAVAAGGNLGALAIPRRCDLIRRIGNDQEVTVQVNLQKIFDGEQPDIFLKANDVLNIGTDLVAPFLLITRNAYRASYGWGYVYDRNLYTGASSSSTP